jgi:hypothetical protein
MCKSYNLMFIIEDSSSHGTVNYIIRAKSNNDNINIIIDIISMDTILKTNTIKLKYDKKNDDSSDEKLDD